MTDIFTLALGLSTFVAAVLSGALVIDWYTHRKDHE